MGKIYLNDLLTVEDSTNWKFKFNISNGYDDPMDLYLKNPDIVNNQWLFWRTSRRYFSVGDIAVCLLKVGNDIWLLTTIQKIEKELDVKDGINYVGKELSEFSQYYGRVILKYHKTRPVVLSSRKVMDELEVLEILPSPYDGVDFPGYDRVNLNYDQLETIVARQKRDWVTALENQKAVYLIRDKSNGKLYVGSATGDNGMLLQRWSNYVTNGHGGNLELKKIADDPLRGMNYIKKNFVYSILENYNSRVDKSYILQRESWWKSVLGTREPFGYNLN